MADGDRHATVLEGPGGIVPLMLDPDLALAHSGVVGEPGVAVEGRIPLPAADDRLLRDGREEGSEAPDTRRGRWSAGSPVEVLWPEPSVSVDHGVEQPGAVRALRDGSITVVYGSAGHAAHRQHLVPVCSPVGDGRVMGHVLRIARAMDARLL